MIVGFRKDTEKEHIVLEIGKRLEKNNLARNTYTRCDERRKMYYTAFYLINTGEGDERKQKRDEVIEKLNKKYPNMEFETDGHPDFIKVDVTVKTNIDDLL